MLTIGLTGGIGSGKTTVSSLFTELGTPIIDTDIIARQLVEPNQPALKEIVEAFGSSIIMPDGQLNRPAMRQLIFSDTEKRHQLEQILHPRIRQEMFHQAESLDTSYCLFVIPLLIENHMQDCVQRILVIDCDDELRRKHLKSRDKMTDEQIDQIFAAQANRQQRISFADDIIFNNKDINHLRTQVEVLHNRYTQISA